MPVKLRLPLRRKNGEGPFNLSRGNSLINIHITEFYCSFKFFLIFLKKVYLRGNCLGGGIVGILDLITLD